MILLTLDSFKGKYALARTEDTDLVLQSYIDTWEAKYIYDVLGVDLGKLLIEEIQFGGGSGSDGLDSRFEDILAPFTVQDTTGQFIEWDSKQWRIFRSLGMVDMLTAFVYFHYVHETQVQHGQSGVALYMGETAQVLKPREAIRLAERKWNAAIGTVDAIQYFCKFLHPTIYPEFKGVAIAVQNNSIF